MHENKAYAEAVDRMMAHLEANGVDLSNDKLQLGIPLKFDPKKERIIGDSEAAKLAVPKYRSPWKFPMKYLRT